MKAENAYEKTTIKRVSKELKHLEKYSNMGKPEEVKLFMLRRIAQMPEKKLDRIIQHTCKITRQLRRPLFYGWKSKD
jgi:hypothetical protein